MRTAADRIRHAVSFEVIALALVTPLSASLSGRPLHDMGVVTVDSALIAAVWNCGDNVLFDHALLRLRGTTQTTVALRVAYVLAFNWAYDLLFPVLPTVRGDPAP